MATYKTYNFNIPSSNLDDYMPTYTKYYYTRPNDNYSDKTSAYSAEINGANNKLNNAEQNKPRGYNSAYTDRINDVLDNIANRKFSYDVNGDALYQQYKNQYMTQGKQAMQDTTAQAALATGGYGNSYAAVAGNQAYQSYLNELNNRIPELYQLALDRYNSETSDLKDLYSLYSNQDSQDYAKYRDRVADYQADRSFYDTQLQNLRTMGQNLWGQNWNNYWNAADRNDTNWQAALNAAATKYGQDWGNYQWAEEQTQGNYEFAVSEDQWADEMAEKIRQFNEDLAYKYYDTDTSAATSRYSADKSYDASIYGANKSAEASKYGADKSYDANIYKANNSGSSGSSSGSKASSSSSGSGISSATSTKRINDFESGLDSRWQWLSSGGVSKNGTYQNYVKDQLDNNATLTYDERVAIIRKYGL